MITSYATGSLENLATVGGGAVGAMALGPGALGMVGGFLLGGFLGRIAMKLIRGGDRELTGGVLFDVNRGGGGGAALAPSGVGTPVASKEVPVSQKKEPSANQLMKSAETNYKMAYQEYINATQGGDAKNIESAHKAYLKAYQEYQSITGQTPK
ncbi:hypothetical protein HYY75_03220 [bacterium]|nr:hypothetical protein [bacterium]